MKDYITIIGGGLAGSEAAYQIAKRGIKVKLYEMKPVKFSEAHSNKNLAEIVCSNSFKSNLLTNACGLLKEELRRLDSLLIRIADETCVPAGQALAVDREKFSKRVTEELENNDLIEIIHREVTDIEEIAKDGIVIIATGPLTSKGLAEQISKITGEDKLYFYDAAAPIVSKESIDFDIAFYGDRYSQEKKKEESIEEWKERLQEQEEIEQSYINLPMNKEEYEKFWEELVEAEVVTLHDFEKREIFEGCMPIEIMAKRGIDTLRFGPLKPVGFDDPRTGRRPYALVQLRQDDSSASIYNLVGFQTNLKFGEQKRVFSMIPGLENAEFVKYGVMHRNTYINSSKLLDRTYNLKLNPNIYFAGQITGVEGYVESISSGMVAALNAVNKIELENKKTNDILKEADIIEDNKNDNNINKHKYDTKYKSEILFPNNTVIGALAKYISTPNEKFQPMNANFGILPELEGKRIRDKKERYQKLAERSLKKFNNM
ncbi:MAG: methylenetetrahydrofolate--tRNA-(uracil(54)-C(5))-methyltransferase (FADH(2)-oxidizing) TrmFO [Clostridia bacterium]|nr:methylenetetrahydrofolate--tRNA-(uracil(54)-C(5))-methyltransferase (FADH(2)-oxidizing) TrmFO [Clostridia bacterium]